MHREMKADRGDRREDKGPDHSLPPLARSWGPNRRSRGPARRSRGLSGSTHALNEPGLWSVGTFQLALRLS
ncbi:unnamed protein product [Arctogadus glacialis]